MKKFVVFMLSIVLLGTMFVMTGCAKKTPVEFTVAGVDDYAAVYVGSQKISQAMQRQEQPDGTAVYTFNAPGDGDYEMMLLCGDGQTYPFTLKVHNGKVETEASEGITVTVK